MKLKALTMIAVLSGLLATSSSEAGKFDLHQIVKNIQKTKGPGIQHTGSGHIGAPNLGGPVNILPYPPIVKPPVYKPKPPVCLPNPPVCKPKPPICLPPKPPICPPVKPPIYCPPPKPPVCPPVKPPVCVKPPICPPVKPPVCEQPACPCNLCKCQTCQCGDQHVGLPINQPPVRVYTLTLMNNAGADVHFRFNGAEEVESMSADDVAAFESRATQGIQIAYHNGLEVVQYDLDPSASYSFEWQDDTLMLLQVEEPGGRLAQR